MFQNRSIVVSAILLLACGASNAENQKKPLSPLDVVNARMAAHNDHDLEKFLSVYSPDIQVYDYPGKPIGEKGKPHIRKIFEPLFADGAVRVEIHQQIAKGNYVVNEETVVRRGTTYEYVSIYEIEKGLIKTVRFIRGPKPSSAAAPPRLERVTK